MIKLEADFSRPVRPMGKLNGTNNGPLCTYSDETENFKQMGVDFIRFHEAHSVNANCVEIPFIFPNFDSDELDPANYNFEATDAVIKSAVDLGAEIMYRFGTATESLGEKVFCVSPSDFEKWSRICIQILKHYNEGWANGFHYGIKYCEIWNEADNKDYWPGEYSEYIRLYCTAAKMLKEYDPTLKIGPAGWAWVFYSMPEKGTTGLSDEALSAAVRFYKDFLAAVTRENIPMDFYPYHSYGDTSAKAEFRTCEAYKLLRDFNLQDIEVINTEWSGASLKTDSRGRWDKSQRMSMQSAIACLGSMVVFQKMGVTKAAYHDADNHAMAFFCGLYDFDSKPRNHFYALKAFKMLRDGETEYHSSGDSRNVRILASKSGNKAFIAVTCENEENTVQLRISGLPLCSIKYYLFDETHKLQYVRNGKYNGRAITFKMEKDSAYILELESINNRF